MRAILLGLLLAGVMAGAVTADDPARPVSREQAYRERRPLDPADEALPPVASDQLVGNMFAYAVRSGREPVAGYKAGLTSAAAQARFRTDRPLLGLLFPSMILPSGSIVEATYGARPVWEADLLLVVGDESINEARDRDEALRALRGFRPFIELPDLVYARDASIDAAMLQRINVGARLGVAGEERPMPADAASSLAAMRVVALDGTGAVLAEGKGSDVLGHPLDVALWVRNRLKAHGSRLRPGDVISVGSFTPLTPPKPGQTIRVRYEGLAGDPEVSVSFR